MPLRAIIMGVSGSGKSALGHRIAARSGLRYLDGDDLHPRANIDRMRQGLPLRDADRWPWLDLIGARLAQDAPIIIGCSALRRSYRDRLRAAAGGPVRFLFLTGQIDVITARMAARQGHFMPSALLASQFATLEPPGPDEALPLDLTLPLDALADLALTDLARCFPGDARATDH